MFLLSQSVSQSVSQSASQTDHSPTHILTVALTHSHTPTHSLTHSLTHARTHPLTHPLAHSITHSLTHSLTHGQVTNSLLKMNRNHREGYAAGSSRAPGGASLVDHPDRGGVDRPGHPRGADPGETRVTARAALYDCVEGVSLPSIVTSPKGEVRVIRVRLR